MHRAVQTADEFWKQIENNADKNATEDYLCGLEERLPHLPSPR